MGGSCSYKRLRLTYPLSSNVAGTYRNEIEGLVVKSYIYIFTIIYKYMYIFIIIIYIYYKTHTHTHIYIYYINI